MRILVTGAAGFVGSHLSHALLDNGHSVVGIDNLNDYYDPLLKSARLQFLSARQGFAFHQIDIADGAVLKDLVATGFDVVVNLAAQAGVRYSIQNPQAYIQSNIVGHLNVVEAVRHAEPRPFLVYASSSSVYGNSTEAPFSEEARVDSPVSLYAATKRADELISESYANLYELPQVGLRFFTVYGHWGRPDMAYYSFAERILNGDPIEVFNGGELERDFTWIGDIVDGVMRIVERRSDQFAKLHRVYNIGNNRPVQLMRFISTLETVLGRSAEKVFLPMQAGDVYSTAADIGAISNDYGFKPTTPIERGLETFAEWILRYRSAQAHSWLSTDLVR